MRQRAADLREEPVSVRVMLQRGAYRMQQRVGRIITDARDIADYEACFATYEALAGYDADARKVFDRLCDEYRTLGT